MAADEDRNLEAYQQIIEPITQRVSKVEADVRIVTYETTRLSTVVDRQTSILDGIAKQINLDQQTTIAIRERTDQHSKFIEHLQTVEVDNSKILNKHENDLNNHTSEIAKLQKDWQAIWTTFLGTVKWFLTVTGGLILGGIVAHYIH